jgi:hypothetical protein
VRVCYLVQSHRDPEQIHRLVRTLRAGSRSGRIVVAHDSAASSLDWSPLAGLPDTHRFEPTGRRVRAHWSAQMQPYLEALAWLEREGLAYDWIVNLTAQDYPVRPVAEIEAFLEHSSADGYVRFWEEGSAESPWSRRRFRTRYRYRYHRLPDGAEPLLRWLRPATRLLPVHFYLDYGPYVGARALSTPFGPGLRCHGGRTWFSLRRKAARYLLEHLAEHPEVERHYRGTIAPEESLVQTILVSSGRFDLVNDDLRYIDYAKAVRGSPRTLTVADLPALSSGRYHFARKFDLGVDREVVDRVDRELLGRKEER